MAPTDGALQLVVGTEQLAMCARLPPVSRHHHAAAAIIVGLDHPLGFRAGATRWSRAVLLAPGFTHEVEVQGGRMVAFLLPPSAVDASRMAPLRELSRGGDWVALGQALQRGELTDFEEISRNLAREQLDVRPVDPRLQRVTRRLLGTLNENLPIEELAAGVHLSSPRLMALCREQLGTSLRAYRRWLRAFEVVRHFAAGNSLTRAASMAGFSSSAHLSSAAREHFGLRPSDVLSPASRRNIVLVGEHRPPCYR
ncbi:MAG: AraC family transcriptional regulator [Polyangiaceae bacterium]|jgi:AraC-like DNA-binding protein|nr:AraC family transcriptional regulator [Polyangiaceae bacterium]